MTDAPATPKRSVWGAVATILEALLTRVEDLEKSHASEPRGVEDIRRLVEELGDG